MRGLLLGCLLVLTGCQRKPEVHADPSVSVPDAATTESTMPRASLDAKGFHTLDENVPADRQDAIAKLFGRLHEQWPKTSELELTIAPEISWRSTIIVLDASRMRGFSVWTLKSGTATAVVDAPRASAAMLPKAEGEAEEKDADPCAFAMSRLEVGASDYDFDGMPIADLEALDAKLTTSSCPSARVVVMADGERPTGRVVTAIARILAKKRKVALGVQAAAPPPLPPPKR